MRAVFIDGKDRIAVRETALPVPGDDEVRIRVTHVGICGSDLHYFFDGANGEHAVREPLIPGHELAAVVDADPSGRLAPGTPVTVHPARFGTVTPETAQEPHLRPGGSYLGSAATWPHTQGAMAEFLVVESRMIRVLPDGLPLERAVLAEPLAVALHAASRSGGVDGRRVLVSGAGPIGLLAIVAARAEGAEHITVSDVLAEPLERARALGADAVLRVGVDDVPAEAFDVVLECSGAAAAISTATMAARRRGVIVQVGMVPNEARPIGLAPLISKEVDLRGAFRFRDEIDRAIEVLAEAEEVARVVTHVIDVAEVRSAFDLARDGARSGKVVVSLTDQEETG